MSFMKDNQAIEGAPLLGVEISGVTILPEARENDAIVRR
jgi:hypothetical protein